MRNLTAQLLTAEMALPLVSVLETLALSRATHYRHLASPAPADPDMELRDHIQRLALQWPQYGYRCITAELRRQGVQANHKRVLRLMREDNLLCLRKRRFISTTDSRHWLTIYPNLVPELMLSGINQLWVADITYIRLLREFVYLAVILDAYSRRCIGWALEPYLEAELAVEALRMALGERRVEAGLVHHSDRGVQYASSAYTELLKERGIRISMSRRGNPYDNAQAERFMRTLKYEMV
jgi:transposase InsO family protein